MTVTNRGRIDWGFRKKRNLHRDYWVKFLIETTDVLDGPEQILTAAGLPAIGSAWTYGNDNDAYALCLPTVECRTVINREPNRWWELKYDFTTEPWRMCAEVDITDPLSTPDVISGGFANYQEMTSNRRKDPGDTGTGQQGKPIVSSSLEPIWVNKDVHKATVSITQTVLNLELDVLTEMMNTLNDRTLWGMEKRCIKLRNTPWRRMVWGLCTYYYERTLEFDIDFETHDMYDVRDVGHRVVDKEKSGYVARTNDEDVPTGSVDRTDQDNFTTNTDGRGNIKPNVMLDGYGEQCTDPVNHEHFIPTVELYGESNFLTLGVPTTL